MRVTRAIALATSLASLGCLSNTHVIPKQELRDLSRSDPQARGERVHVVQQFSTSEQPPPADPVRPSASVHAHVVVPVRIGPARRPNDHGHPREPPPPSVDPPAPKSSSESLAEAEADNAYWWIVAAAAVAVGLAATEGARYDGWVRLHPMHPVHLYGPRGEYTTMPLAHIDPQTAAWADRAVIRESEGPWKRLGRAPLDRTGLSYSVLLGAAELPSTHDDEDRGFLGHIQLGYFPATEVGLLLDVGLGWRDNQMDETLFDSRWALELQVLPLEAGRLHAGGFGQIGFGGRLEDGPQERSFSRLVGGGGLMQLELTTYLAITARAGITDIHGFTSSDFGLGLSIY